MDQRLIDIEKMEAALKRMESKGFKDTDSYATLKGKLEAIKSGAEYTITDVTMQAIGSVGALFPSAHTMYSDFKTQMNMVKKLNEARAFITSKAIEQKVETFKGYL